MKEEKEDGLGKQQKIFYYSGPALYSVFFVELYFKFKGNKEYF